MKAKLPLLLTLSLCACEQRSSEPEPPAPQAAPAPAAGSLEAPDPAPSEAAAPAPSQTATSTAAAEAMSSEEERADGCLYAEAELRGVKNPALARSAVQNRARAKMKARLKALKAELTPAEQAALQRWLEGARVEVPRVQMTARGWSAKARLDLSGLKEVAPALYARLLTPQATPAAGTP